MNFLHVNFQPGSWNVLRDGKNTSETETQVTWTKPAFQNTSMLESTLESIPLASVVFAFRNGPMFYKRIAGLLDSVVFYIHKHSIWSQETWISVLYLFYSAREGHTSDFLHAAPWERERQDESLGLSPWACLASLFRGGEPFGRGAKAGAPRMKMPALTPRKVTD